MDVFEGVEFDVGVSSSVRCDIGVFRCGSGVCICGGVLGV